MYSSLKVTLRGKVSSFVDFFLFLWKPKTHPMKYLVKSFLIIVLFLSVTSPVNAQRSVTNYINKYVDVAVEQMKKYQIPASIILGVSIVESAAGQSVLAKFFNNHFGIKGKNSHSLQKLGYKSSYKEYENDMASYDHFCNVIVKKGFYKKLKGDKDYKEWLHQMNRANYAEAKQIWVNKIMATIKKYKLYQYDML